MPDKQKSQIKTTTWKHGPFVNFKGLNSTAVREKVAVRVLGNGEIPSIYLGSPLTTVSLGARSFGSPRLLEIIGVTGKTISAVKRSTLTNVHHSASSDCCHGSGRIRCLQTSSSVPGPGARCSATTEKPREENSRNTQGRSSLMARASLLMKQGKWWYEQD